MTKGLEFPLDKVGKVGYYRRRRSYSTSIPRRSKGSEKEQINTSNTEGSKLNPMWVTGFSDAEGCFSVIIEILEPLKWRVRVSF